MSRASRTSTVETAPSTRQLLLRAAAEACVERGFEGVTMADIARRVGVSTPAIYNHFGSKSELMVEACRVALDDLADRSPTTMHDPAEIVRRYLSPDFADARILQTELHLAALRHADVRQLLDEWHVSVAGRWRKALDTDDARLTCWFLLLLGLSQLDTLAALRPDAAALDAAAQRAASAIFGG